MSCADLCTAAKCQELEVRIVILERDLANLKRAFEVHEDQDIPEAHNSKPSVGVNTSFDNNILTTEVTIDQQSDFSQVELNLEPNVSLDIFQQDDNSYLFKATVNDSSDEDILYLPLDVTVNLTPQDELEVSVQLGDQVASDSTALPDSNVSVDVFEQGDDQIIKVQVGNDSDQDILQLPTEPNLSINGSFLNEVLTITYSHGDQTDSFTVPIPIDTQVTNLINNNYGGGGGGQEHIPSNLSGTATYRENILTISIADGESQTVFQTQILTMDQETKKKIEKIYQILGGDAWATSSTGELSLPLEPEKLIQEVGNVLYAENSESLTELTVTNLLELFTAFSTVDFYRSGHHRLPSEVLPSLLNNVDSDEDELETVKIYDALSFSEWTVQQIDGLVGEFPLKIKYQTANPDNNQTEETEMVLPNVSEAIAELIALSLATSQDADLAVNISMKGLVEARNAANAAITAVDYGAANAEYLGYRGNQYKKDVPLTFTPGASSLAASLQPSTKSIVGWKNEDQETLIEILKKTLIGTEIVKAALFHPYQPGGTVAGDAVAQTVQEEQESQDQKWSEFINRVNNPAGRYDVPKPKAKIRDLSIDSNPAQS